MKYKKLTKDQIALLIAAGSTATDWSKVRVAPDFDPARIRNTNFIGEITIGSTAGNVKAGTVEKPCGIYNATLIDTAVGDNVRISNIAVHIANYDIEDNVCIEDAGVIETGPDAKFGNGIEVMALNEVAHREVIIFNELSAQFAYLMCLHRDRPKFTEKLKAIANRYVDSIKIGRGTISRGASIRSVRKIVDTCIGESAVISGASKLINGTILSTPDAKSYIGTDVIAKDFIIAEGATVETAADIDKVFVGQAVHIGKGFSAENSLFFANCECLNGEAVSIFAGPYTVSHHKSTLLIAGLFSFFNAGSGTDHSNHMYRLGPVHEGKLERGCKCGSSSHMFWPCRIGPFSVVLGKHPFNIDVSDFPFSRIMPDTVGTTLIAPAIQIPKIGTARDSMKWPQRDKRTCQQKRDIINFDLFSPYTVGRMMIALQRLDVLLKAAANEYYVSGAMLKRYDAENAEKIYASAVKIYLLEKIFEKASKAMDKGLAFKDFFATDGRVVYDPEWVDLAGQLVPASRVSELCDSVENESIDSAEKFAAQMTAIDNDYDRDQWAWVVKKYEEFFGKALAELDGDELAGLADTLVELKQWLTDGFIADAKKEYSEISMIGFGMDGTDAAMDFEQVRGRLEDDGFVEHITQQMAQLENDAERFKAKLANF
jgi:NDP-sugar pyrophosphorylase family protein